MRNLAISLLVTIVFATGNAQSDKVFNYSDSSFEVGSIRYLDLVFDFNGGWVIKDSLGLIELKALSKFLKSHPKMKFIIEHHTDNRGSEAYNQKLSEHRAERLTNELIYNFLVDSTQIRPQGYGESKPIIKTIYFQQLNPHHREECYNEAIHAINRRTLLRIREIE